MYSDDLVPSAIASRPVMLNRELGFGFSALKTTVTHGTLRIS